MITTVRKKVRVGSGGHIDLSDVELTVDLVEGLEAVVEITVDAPVSAGDTAEDYSLYASLGKASGHYQSVEEVDTFIRKERDQWDQ